MAASTALISSTPRAFSSAKSTSLAPSSFSKPQSQTLTFPKSFNGLRLPCTPRSISLSRGSHSAKSFAVKASVSNFRSISSQLQLGSAVNSISWSSFLIVLVSLGWASIGWKPSTRFWGRGCFWPGIHQGRNLLMSWIATLCIFGLLKLESFAISGQTVWIHWEEICDSIFLSIGLHICLPNRFVFDIQQFCLQRFNFYWIIWVLNLTYVLYLRTIFQRLLLSVTVMLNLRQSTQKSWVFQWTVW